MTSIKEGEALGIHATPTMFGNGQMVNRTTSGG